MSNVGEFRIFKNAEVPQAVAGNGKPGCPIWPQHTKCLVEPGADKSFSVGTYGNCGDATTVTRNAYGNAVVGADKPAKSHILGALHDTGGRFAVRKGDRTNDFFPRIMRIERFRGFTSVGTY